MRYFNLSQIKTAVTGSAVFIIFCISAAFGQVPEDVILNDPTGVTSNSLNLSWTQCADDTTFKEYRLYRSTSASVDIGDDLVTTISDRAILTYTDTALHIATAYYYKVFVIDTSDTYSSGSNEVSATTLPNYYPLFDDVESGDLKWFIPTGTWAVSDDDAYSGTYNWSDSPNGPYSSNVNNSLSTAIILSGASMPMLSFYHRYNFETNNDHGLVEISTNQGSNWTVIYSTTGYSGSNWEYESIDLTPYIGQEVYLRFRVVSNSSINSDGWHIDNIRIDETTIVDPTPFPFVDDFNDTDRSDSLWISSSWGLTQASYDGSQYFHSRPNGNYYTYTYTSLVSANNIDLTNAGSPILTFWHYYNDYYGDLRVLISSDNGATYSTLATYNGSVGWTKAQISLSTYTGLEIRLRFYINGQSGGNYWLIENVRIEEAPGDVVLNDPTNIGRHNATLNWTANIDADFGKYELYRSISSGITRSGSPYKTFTDPATISYIDSALTYTNTRYYYRMFVADTLDDYSYGSNEVSALSPFVSVNSYPFFDDMESGDSSFAEDQPWEISNDDAYSGSYSWSDSPDGSYASDISRALYFPISLTGSGISMPMLSFYHRYNFETSNDHGLVEISTNQGSNWTVIYSTTGYSGLNWEYESIDLTPYIGQEVYLRFRVVSNSSINSDGWHIDNIRIDETTKVDPTPFPFVDDFNDTDRSDSLWISSSWGLTQASYDGSQYFHSRPNGNYYTYTYTSLVSANNIDLTNAESPILTFWHYYNDYYGDLRVLISSDNGATYSTLATYNGSVGWTKAQISLSTYTGLEIRLRFYINGQSGGNYWLIENVRIEEEPVDVVLNNPTDTGRHNTTLSWTANIEGDFGKYELYRSTSSGITRSGSPYKTFTDPATISYIDSALTYTNTRYYYKLFIVNTLDNFSYGSNEVNVLTPFTAVNSYPFFDDMESSPDNFAEDQPWEISDDDAYSGSYSWSDSPGGPYASNISRSLYLPISLTGQGISMPMLSFYHRYNFETSNDHGLVEISTNQGSSWTLIYSTTGYSGSNWEYESIDLTPYIGQEVYLRFRVVSNSTINSDGWHIDNIRVDETTKKNPLPFPFVDGFNNTEYSDSLWISSSWGLTQSSYDGSQYFHSRPKGNYYTYTYTSLVSANNIDLMNAESPILTFWHYYNDYYGDLRVLISSDNGATYSTLATYNGSVGWTKVQISLSTYAGLEIRLRFYINGQSGGNYWLIENVSIQEDFTGLPIVDFAHIQSPEQVSTTIGGSSEFIYGLVYEEGVTDSPGQGDGVLAELGYGSNGTMPDDGWTWLTANYFGSSWSDSADVYRAALTGTELGVYDFAYRFSIDNGTHWIYGDLDGNDAGMGGDNFYSITQAGTFLVTEEPEMILNVSTIDMTLPVGIAGSRVFSIWNTGVGPLGVNLNEDIDWLTVVPNSVAIEPGSFERISFGYDATDLTLDSTYTGTVYLTTNDPDNLSDSISVSLTVIPEGSTPLTGFIRQIVTGMEIGYALIGLYEGGASIHEMTTGEDGFFSVYGLTDGDYDAHITASGYYPKNSTISVPSTNTVIRLNTIPHVFLTNESVNAYSSASLFDGRTISIGDVISARDPDGVVCGIFQVHTEGQYGFMHVYADDPMTPDVDEGAVPGDTLTFYINDFPSETLGPNEPIWTSNNAILNMDLAAEKQDVITLNQNWNLVSFTAVPENDSVANVLESIGGNYIRVSGFDMDWDDRGLPGARTYDPLLPEFNDLISMDAVHGYWIKMSVIDTLTILGEKVHDDTPLPLDFSWNLTGYLPETKQSVEDALQSIAGDYSIVSGFDEGALTHIPESQFNDLHHLSNGFGYWIRMEQPGVLSYRGMEGTNLAKMMAFGQSGEIPDVTPTPWWSDYYGKIDFPEGSVIEAYDPDGVKCGEFMVRSEGVYGFFHIYGDDPGTEVDEGALSGDIISFMHDGTVVAMTPETFTWNGSRDIINFNMDGTVDISSEGDLLPESFGLSQNFPNPFNPVTSIQYQLPEPGTVTLTIFNMLGQWVKTVVQGHHPAGYHQITWNGTNESGQSVASGVYLFSLEIRDENRDLKFNRVRKMVLLR